MGEGELDLNPSRDTRYLELFAVLRSASRLLAEYIDYIATLQIFFLIFHPTIRRLGLWILGPEITHKNSLCSLFVLYSFCIHVF